MAAARSHRRPDPARRSVDRAGEHCRPAAPLAARLADLCWETGSVPVEVHCTATDELLSERLDQRRSAGARHPGHAGFEERATFVDDLRDRPHGPLGLGGPLIGVDTSTSWPEPRAVAHDVRRQLRAAVRHPS